MSENKELKNKELNEVNGGYYFVEKTDVPNIEKNDVWEQTYNSEKNDLCFRSSKSDVAAQPCDNNAKQMDNIFVPEKKGIAAIIESFIKSLKNLFKF